MNALDQWASAWSSGDVDTLLSLFTDDVYYEDVTFGAVNQGKDALRGFANAALGAFPGMTFELTSRFASSDGKWAGMEWVWRGRQTQDFPGLPATNTPFQVRGASILELRGAKISRCSDYWDLATFKTQVGA
jgi:steroid delta-isomerase-like uncharacterized protein